ncbi:MAG: hypothetical protein IKJ39_09260 [Lachnospiraceae bacterium]|nr:hypothetical protein [Lachnospiraceae bacterium]
MAVCKKGRRKINVDNREYIWYVNLDDDSPYHMLHILSEDKALILACPIEAEVAYVISKGKVFQNKRTTGIWNRYLLPFSVPEAIVPSFVAQVIVWATKETGAESIDINRYGKRNFL